MKGQTLGHISIIQPEIRTMNDRSVYARLYRYPQVHEEEISDQIQDMLYGSFLKGWTIQGR